MLLTPPAGKWAPHYTANMYLPKAHYTLLHHTLQGQKAQQKDLASTNLSPWVYGASKLQHLLSADMLPLHTLSQEDPAFGKQQGITVGGFSNWVLHKVRRFQVPCLPLPYTVGALVYLRNIHSFGKRNKHPANHFLSGKDASQHAEFLTAFCCRHKLTMSLLHPEVALIWSL